MEHLDPILTNMNNATTTNPILGSLHVESHDSTTAWAMELHDRLSLIPRNGTVAVLCWGMMMVAGQEVGFAGFCDY